MSWNVVQSKGALGFATSISVTFTTANLSAGNKIIAYVASASSTVPTSVQDGSGNQMTLVGSSVNTTPTGGAWVYAMDVPAADAGTKPTITASGMASNGVTIIVQEVSGLAAGTTAAVDGTPGTLTGTATSTGSPTYSSSAANEYLICFYGNNQGSQVPAALSGWTKDTASQTSQSHASLEYTNSTGGAETSGWTNSSPNGWEIVTLAFKLAPQAAPLVTPPPLIPPHPLFTDALLGAAWQRADWQAQGVADLTVAFSSSSGGVDTYTTLSPWNVADTGPQAQHIRVVRPVTPNTAYPHAFLIMLPVDSDQGTTYGDPIAVAQAISANDTWNLTVVQPGMALHQGPNAFSSSWFGDNPLKPGISEEKFLLLVLNWVKANLATTGQEPVYLIGFSRSGLAAQFLLFRHPYLFTAAASWDTPFGMTDYNGTDPFQGTVGGNPETVFGTSASYQANYQLTAARLAAAYSTGQFAQVNRIWMGQGPDFGSAEPAAYDTALTAAGIPHTYNFSNSGETHAWHTDWVAAALPAIIPSSEPTVLPQQIPRHYYTQLLEIAAYRMTGAPLPAQSGPVPAALADSGTGTDALAVTATTPLADSGTAADALAVAATAPLADSAAAADTATVAAASPLTDTGTGTGTIGAGLAAALADTGAAADALTVSAAVPLTASAAALDQLTAAVSAAFAESGLGADHLSVSTPAQFGTATATGDTVTAVTASSTATVTVTPGGQP